MAQGGESGSQWSEEGIKKEGGWHGVFQVGRDFARSRKSSSLHGLLKLGKGKKEIPPGPKQQCKPNTGFESLNGVRRMSVREMRQTE